MIFAAVSFKLVPSVNRIVRITQAIKYNTPLTQVILNELNLSKSLENDKSSQQDKIMILDR